ncbi:hypothetical protein Tco_0672127, partial [Tanacetum coccineum]
EAKLVIYNALPRKKYERIFMCNTAKEIWKNLLITHQGNSKVKDNKIDFLVEEDDENVKNETCLVAHASCPTFELMKGTCKSLTELEYFCEEVYKATTEKLDWINPEGRQYPHDLRQPLPLVPNSQGRRVIPFHHFINNDLEYLRGGVSSRKYSTSITGISNG